LTPVINCARFARLTDTMKEEFYRILHLMNAAQENYVNAIKNNAPDTIRKEIWRTIQLLAEEMLSIYKGSLVAEQKT